MRLRTIHHTSTAGKINVTPLIDVVMVLIVFFLIVGKLAQDRQARVELPRTAAGAVEANPAQVVVNVVGVERGASIVVEGATMSAEQLEEFLRRRLAAEPGAQVQLRADRRLKYAEVAPALEACRLAGLSAVRLVAERSP